MALGVPVLFPAARLPKHGGVHVLLPSFENNTVRLLPLVTEGHDEALNYGIARRQELSESTLRTGKLELKL